MRLESSFLVACHDVAGLRVGKPEMSLTFNLIYLGARYRPLNPPNMNFLWPTVRNRWLEEPRLRISVRLGVRLVGAGIPYQHPKFHFPTISSSKFLTTDALWYFSVRAGIHSKGLARPTSPKFHLPMTSRSKSVIRRTQFKNLRPTLGASCWGRGPLPAHQISLSHDQPFKILYHERISVRFSQTRRFLKRPCPAPPIHQLWTLYVIPFKSY